LQPGAKRHLEFVLGSEHLGFYNRDLKFVVEPGEFKIMVGANSQDVTETSLIVQ
jgi:beta-glucosidase